MADKWFTVYVYENNSITPTREYNGIKAATGEGAVDRVVDMFHAKKEECHYVEEH